VNSRWHHLVVETQFATELILSGIRRVSALPMDGSGSNSVSYDRIYPLHVGLHQYTSGLERLCKLAFACHGFISSGSFTQVRRYSHRLGELQDALESLDLEGLDSYHREYLIRPEDEYGDELLNWLERYSTGGGRYEILDSLALEDTEILTWELWVQFCARGIVSESVDQSIQIHSAVGAAMTDLSIANDLESAAGPFLEAAFHPLSKSAAAVGLAMHRRARWAAEILASVTNYTHAELPILREVVNVLTQTSDNFFAYEVAGISDTEPVIEELVQHAELFTMPTFEDEEDWLDDDQDPPQG